MGTNYHVIKKLGRGQLPRRFFIVTAAPVTVRQGTGVPLFVHRLRMGAFTYLHRDGLAAWSIKHHVYHTGEELVDLMARYSSKREVSWLCSHDLGYHLTVSELWIQALLGHVEVLGYHFQGRSCSAIININGKRIHCVDTQNYVDRPWTWLCNALSVQKRADWSDSDTDSEALEKAELENDTIQALIMDLCDFLRDEAANSWGWSLGALAWQSWRRSHMSDRVHVHADPSATDLEREAYLGGRAECRYLGQVNGPVHVADFNSLYAHVMQFPLPTKLLGQEKNIALHRVEAMLDAGHLAVARLSVDTKECDYPYYFWPGHSEAPSGRRTLPAYMAKRGQYAKVWGRGRFQTTIATPEIRRALSLGNIASVSSVAWYQPGLPFSRFVDHWYARRLHYRAKGKALQEAMCKRLLTTMHGKFGQHNHDWLDVPGRQAALPFGHWYEMDATTGDMQLYRSLGGMVQVYSEPGEWEHSFPGLSAHITSAARVLTDTAVECAGIRDCFYHDTDAVHVSRVGLERLQEVGMLHETELGRLKLKGSFDGCWYRNAFDFRLGPCIVGQVPGGNRETKTVRADEGPVEATSARGSTDINGHGADVPALHGGSPIYNMLRTGADAWRSLVCVQSARRNRYVGRVASDGWVMPLWLPKQETKPAQEDLFSEALFEKKRPGRNR